MDHLMLRAQILDSDILIIWMSSSVPRSRSTYRYLLRRELELSTFREVIHGKQH